MFWRLGPRIWVVGLLLMQGCSLFSRYTLPAPYVPREPSASDWPDVGAVILEDVTTLEYRVMTPPGAAASRLVAVQDRRRKLKVLRESGLAQADVELNIDGFTTVTRVVARSVTPEGAEQPMSPKALQAYVRSDPSARAPDVKTLKFHIPGAVVGGVVEYRYERVYADPYLVPPYVFGDPLPTMHAEFGLVVGPQIKVDYRFAQGDKVVDRPPLHSSLGGDQERLLFVEKDLPALYPEPMSPHITRDASWIGVALRTERLGDTVHRLETWNDVGGLIWRRLQETDGEHGVDGNPLQRYQTFRQAVHPVLLPGLGVRAPQSLPELWHGAPACSRDAAMMLVRAWEDSGVDAYAAMLTGPSGPPAHDDFPALYPFVRAGVALQMTQEMMATQNCGDTPLKQGPLCGTPVGGFVWVDPLCKLCAFGTFPSGLAGGRAFLVSKNQSGWVDMPVDPPQRNAVEVALKWDMDATGALEGTGTATVRGFLAAATRQDLIDTHRSQDDQTRVVKNVLLSPVSDGKLSSFKLVQQADLELPLGVEGRMSAKAMRKDYERFLMRPVDIAGSAIPEGWMGTRRTAALLDSPRWLETDVTVQLPAGYRAEVRPPIKVARDFAEYAAGFAIHGRQLRFSRRFVVKSHVVEAKDWADFQAFLETIRDFEQEGPQVFAPE